MRYLIFFVALVIASPLEERGGHEKKLCCNVKISPDQIPTISAPMPVYTTCDFVAVPQDYLDDIISNISPGTQLESFGTSGASAAFDDGTLIAFVRPDTGESRAFPLLECLKPGCDLTDKAMSAAQQFAQNQDLFPPDDTELVVLPPTTLSGSTSNCQGNATAPEQFLGFAKLQRQINGYPVEGPGFQAAIAVDDSGCIKAFAHRYRAAFASSQTIVPHCPEDVVNSIIEDLNDTCTRVNVTIDQVLVKYFDSGTGFIQPVYTYQGSIPSSNASTTSQLTGSISIGTSSQAIEPVPSTNYPSNAPAGFYRRRGTGINVGRYVVRADSLEWLDSATAFLSNLQLASTYGGTLSFIDDQYLAATPDMFITDKNSYVNSVQIALNEVHGNWWEFTTYKNDGDIVTLQEIAAVGGLGSNANGSLAYWVLHSCEVIPTQTDESNSFDIWWQLFKGLHSVVGYRTEMYIGDGVTTNFGLWVGLGAPIVSSWIVEIATDNDYGGSDAFYFDTNRQITEPLGRASAVSVCGHLDDTACEVQGLANPSCLVEMWLDN